ncbi:MAG: hypothetical protein O3B73_11545 [bacterium]|nr:hypothetical protein [bacterium]
MKRFEADVNAKNRNPGGRKAKWDNRGKGRRRHVPGSLTTDKGAGEALRIASALGATDSVSGRAKPGVTDGGDRGVYWAG